MKKLQLILEKAVIKKKISITTSRVLLQEIELESYKLPVREHMHIQYQSRVYEVMNMTPLGWYMQVVYGPPTSKWGNNPKLYLWDHPIYSQGQRFIPIQQSRR